MNRWGACLLWFTQREDGGSSDEDDSVPFFSHLSPTATTAPSIEDRITSAIQQPSLVQETPISEGLAGYALNNSHQSQAYVTLGEPHGTSWYSGSHTYASYPDPTADYTPQQQYQYSYQQGQSAHSYGQQGDNPVQIEGGVSARNEPELDNESVSVFWYGLCIVYEQYISKRYIDNLLVHYSIYNCV